jgi:cobalamin biosynthesis protein CobT
MTNLVNGMVAESLTAVSDWSNPMQYPFILAVYARRYANKVPMPKELISIFENASTQIDTCNNTADALVVAQWVYDQLQAIGDEPDQDQDQGDDHSGDQSGDQGDDQGDEQSGDGDGQSEGDGEDGAQDGSGRPTSDQNANGDTSPPTTDKSAQKPNGKAREVEPTCEVPTGKQGIGAYNKKELMVKPDYFMDQCCDHDLSANVSARLQYDVRKLFENTGHESFERNKRSGVLNRSSIASIAQGKTNVFKRHLAVGGIDSAVVIGLDLSWSMLDYNRFPNALKTANALMHVLTKAGVAVAIIGFSDNVSVLKPFEMNSFNGENVLRKTKLDNSTNDYLAIRYGHELLQSRGEARKVLFMLTDGEGAMSESQLQIESGNRVGITTVGIGIGVDISDTYKTNLLVKNADDLGNASFSKIKLVA